MSNMEEILNGWGKVPEMLNEKIDGNFATLMTRIENIENSISQVVPVIIKQPENVTANVGDTVNFIIEAKGINLTYQWQYSKDDGITWLNNTIEGAITNSITFVAQISHNNRPYRCVVTDGFNNSVISETGILTVVS